MKSPLPSRVVSRYVASRVADRYLEARDWSGIYRSTYNYNRMLTLFGEYMEKNRANPSPGIRGGASAYLSTLIPAARELSEWVLQTRSIPAGKTKAVELAARLFAKMSRVPQDPLKWYDTNRPLLQLLVDAQKWGEKAEGTEGSLELGTAGSFKVHNTIGADEKKFRELLGLVEAADRTLSTTRDFRKVLYGDVYIVGQLRGGNTLAWYFPSKDEVYVRSLAKKGVDDLHSLIHELGHRYWERFASTGQKRAVVSLYSALKVDSVRIPVERPKVGDILPVPLKGVKVPPTILKDTGRTFELSTGGSVRADAVMELMRREKASKGTFPSAYSMKDHEEFFAECFAFYSMGKLSPELTKEFEEALDFT